MKAIDRPFMKIINGTTQFVIPVFQRDYSWSEEQCEQLWRDVLAVGSDEQDRGHFLGSVVYVSSGDSSAGFTRWLLIDGQQRVTTLTLLMAALRDHLECSGWRGSEESPTARRIEAYFLKNMQEEGARLNKLVLRRHDHDTLDAILNGKEMPEPASERVRENYEFFRSQLLDADPDVVYRGLGRLIVVDVTLDPGVDDPQLIFESLNSTGVDLSQSDLIRNFILMRLPEPEQTRLYNQYWGKIEAVFRGAERVFDAFVRDYLALRTRATKQERADNVYFAFRRAFQELADTPEGLDGLLSEMLRFARYYAAFTLGAGVSDAATAPLARLRRLVDVPAILVMRLFACRDRAKILNESEFIEAVGLLESYVLRRAVCGEQTRGYWQVFATLAYRLDESNPLASLRVGLARQPDSYRFPSNEEFRAALEERDLYGKRICFDVLDRLENFDTREWTDTSGYSIEHIMPQNERLVTEWRQMLGDEWQAIQRQWLHRLGNLTLTGYNSKYSDRPFKDKKDIPGGFADSAVHLNRFVKERDQWTPAEMEARGRQLAGKALKAWPDLRVEQSLLDAARQADMLEAARRRDVSKVPMAPAARELFHALRNAIVEMDDQIIEMAEQKSVSYHGPEFFLEVLPRINRLNLLLPLDFNEIDDPHGIASDATQWKFFVNARYEGGVLVSLRGQEEIAKALPLVRQAYGKLSHSGA